MIKTIHIEDKHYINLPQEEMDRIRTTYNSYQGRFGVLLHPISIERSNEKQVLVLEKGTLVEVHSNTLDGYNISIKSIFNEKIEYFRLVDKNFVSVKHKMAKEIGKDAHDVEFTDQDIELYSKQRCIDYIEEHIGFAEELDNTCKPLERHYNNICTHGEEHVMPGVVSLALFGFMDLLLISSDAPKFIILLVTLLACGGITYFGYSLYSMFFETWSLHKLIKEWTHIDTEIARIVSVIEGQNAPREIIEQPKLLTSVTNLLTVDPIPTT